jgi:hypothetical protein
MSEQARDGALAAYWQFFESFNTRDSEKFASALQFPHLRVSARGPAPSIIAKPDLQAQGTSYERVLATGWHHTIGAEPEVLHLSPEKVHIRGGWTRYNKDDEPILTNFVTYIVTLVENHWGIQCRFGVDPGPDGETPKTAATALTVLEGALAAMGSGDLTAATELFNYPHFNIDPGDVRSYASADEVAPTLPSGDVKPSDLRALQSGPNSVSMAFDAKIDRRDMQGVVLATEREGHWGIESRSIIVH